VIKNAESESLGAGVTNSMYLFLLSPCFIHHRLPFLFVLASQRMCSTTTTTSVVPLENLYTLLFCYCISIVVVVVASFDQSV
jgi:hypothetical protein